MDLYVFRLDEKHPGAFRGIVVVFLTQVPAVWRMLVSDGAAELVPHMVATAEAATLAEELGRLWPGAHLTGGTGPLWQVFGDADLTRGYRVTFVEHDRVTVVGSALSEASMRGWVEHWFHRVAAGGDPGD